MPLITLPMWRRARSWLFACNFAPVTLSDCSLGVTSMVRNGEFTTADVKRVLRKHWWMLPACALGFAAMCLLVATQIPKQYTSRTLVLVSRPAVPADYVKPVVTEDLSQRLSSMKGEILSRSRLEPIIEKFNLYVDERPKVHMEDLVERLRKAVVVSPLEAMPGTQDRSLPGFEVNVTFNNAQLAQQICTEITSMFLEQNSRALEQQASRTTLFISRQLDEAKAKLDEQDAKLAQFKRQYIGMLPEEGQGNLTLLTTLNSQLDANTQALSRAQQDKTFNESLLSQQQANRKKSETDANPETLEEQLRTRQEQLAVLESRYTAEHPDVVKMKNEISELKKKIEGSSNLNDARAKSRKMIEPPEMQQLRAKIQEAELNYTELLKRQTKIQDQIRVVESHIEASPMVEQQLKELTRNYQSALDFYNDLLRKRDNSAMARDLVHQQEGEQFRVLDPPSLPTNPSFPKILNFAGGGLGGGTALGLFVLYLLMLMDKTLHTERDVETYLKLPVLTSLPVLDLPFESHGDGESLKLLVAARN
ncbi:MAG: lipopolysaccharide biosynthesis protein [Acidobacteria bacterium]|nr:MAG: lipopolysaccharide biosynthesis protein [Acidobacteriota bacterium]